MPVIHTDDGVALHAESTGTGQPLLFIHEFAGDHRSWEPQVRYFSARLPVRHATPPAATRRPTCPPIRRYSPGSARSPTRSPCWTGSGIGRAHVVGLSMGGFAALHLLLRHPDRVLSAVVAGAGYGAQPDRQAAFRAECEAIAAAFEAEGAAQVAQRYAVGPGAGAVPEQEPARLGRVRRGAGRALRAGLRADHARRAGRPALAVRAARRARRDRTPGADPGRRRGRGLPGARADAQAHHPDLRRWPSSRRPVTPPTSRNRACSTRPSTGSSPPRRAAPGRPATRAHCRPPPPGYSRILPPDPPIIRASSYQL